MKYSLLLFLLSLSTFRSFSQQEKTDSIKLKDAVLYYYTYGAGKPIIILSGGPGVESHQEDDLARELSKKYKAILFDQRGTGKSWSKPFDSTTININTAIEDLEVLRKHLKIDKLAIAGHSWGGMLSAAYTARYPDKVKLLILNGAGELDLNTSEIIDENIGMRVQPMDTINHAFWTDSLNSKKDPVKAELEIRKLIWSLMIYDRKLIDKVMIQVEHGKKNDIMGSLMWKSLKKNYNPAPGLAKYKGDALIIFGWQDPVGAATFNQYEKVMPKAVVKGINKCGHMPTVEQPAIFYEAIFAFLEEKYK